MSGSDQLYAMSEFALHTLGKCGTRRAAFMSSIWVPALTSGNAGAWLADSSPWSAGPAASGDQGVVLPAFTDRAKVGLRQWSHLETMKLLTLWAMYISVFDEPESRRVQVSSTATNPTAATLDADWASASNTFVLTIGAPRP